MSGLSLKREKSMIDAPDISMIDSVIKLDNVDLIYKTNQSLSIKVALRNLVLRKKNTHANEFMALRNVTLDIKRGKVYGIIGNNGAGKSTLLKVLSGVMSPNSGTMRTNYKTINLLALGLGFTKEISGRDNIVLNGLILGFSMEEIRQKMQSIIDYSEIGDFIEKQMKTYSSGMVSRLGFAIAINLRPEVLLIDEVLSVGDIGFQAKSFNSIKELIKDESITVVIVAHNLKQLQELCDEIVWMEKGNIIECGSADVVLEKYRQKTMAK